MRVPKTSTAADRTGRDIEVVGALLAKTLSVNIVDNQHQNALFKAVTVYKHVSPSRAYLYAPVERPRPCARLFMRIAPSSVSMVRAIRF